MDAAVARIKREIELLAEYRKRLITDIVTGKLDVRATAARLPEEISPVGEKVLEEGRGIEEMDDAAEEAA